MAIYLNDILDVDLDKGGISRSRLDHSIGKSDDDANRFGVHVLRAGAEEDLTGITCKGYFTDSQGNRQTITGTVSGSVAYVTLTDACYTYAGPFRLAIKLEDGSVKSTVRIVDGMIENIA